MRLLFTRKAWEQYIYWQEIDRSVINRINELLEATLRDPFKAIGKPEPLKGKLSGLWSRRITGEHRLVYRCVGMSDEQRIEVLQCRYHY